MLARCVRGVAVVLLMEASREQALKVRDLQRAETEVQPNGSVLLTGLRSVTGRTHQTASSGADSGEEPRPRIPCTNTSEAAGSLPLRRGQPG